MKNSEEYIPALKYNFLTPLYDFLLRWTLRESTFKSALVRQANIREQHQILDIGCGTGTLTLLTKQMHPQSQIFGIDGDSTILEIAKRKSMSTNIQFDRGMCYALPYSDNSFDRAISSLLFHHLTTDNKKKTLKEIFRILKPGGEVHIADWGKAQDPIMRTAFLLIQMLDGFKTTTDNVKGQLLCFLSEADFQEVKEVKKYRTVYGTLSLYKGVKT
ncbi:class I SAM-dependent methyltransferase [Candidatus Uabimicrobium amorphum]|uniref:Ubiquinone biosynthesis protein UbiE n=1 Tax=Uabimicrobium amorphum TaxID=2596890 RepID=A0A5S9IUY8_UABAM|nr:class I SAM-dependent methyltransferase [Candidatus Uabimicrobium amorphum]BBM87055.1 ubiquinone biosynthesis protein UbiE [Candidatus Uabimicrobium amorphum]